MLIARAKVALLIALPAPAAFAAGSLAHGPNAVVPDGAPLPAPYVAHADAACDNLGTCGVICPSGGSVFIGDFAYDLANDRFAVIDVTSPDGIFWMDASTCVVESYGDYAGISQRACGYDNVNSVIYTASWNDETIWRLDDDFNVLGSQFFGEGYAGLPVDEDGTRLFAATNASPDMLIEYSIEPDGSVTPTGESWAFPWGGFSDDFSAASLEYDDCSETFMSINQDANTMEYFQIQGGALVNTGYCPLPLSFGWGFGLNFASVDLKVADIASFACDFPIISVEADEAICGSGEIPDLTIRYDPIMSTAVQGYVLPYGAKIKNNTDQTLTRTVWVELDFPHAKVDLGSYDFAPGTNQLYGNAGPLPMPAGTYVGQAHLAESFQGTPEASDDISYDVVNPGIEE